MTKSPPASLPTHYFRSITTGNWNTPGTWESSPLADFSSGVVSPATLAPDDNANTITIRNAHNVTITSAVTADQLLVAAGGTLTQNGLLIINNGSGDDFTIAGTWIWNSDNVDQIGFPMIVNNGTVEKNGGDTRTIYADAINNGIVNINAGTLVSRSSWTNQGTLNLISSTFRIGEPGIFYHNTGSAIAGNGSLVLQTFNSVLTLNTDLTLPPSIALIMQFAGTVSGPGNLTTNGLLDWDGDFSGSGALNINANAIWRGRTNSRNTIIASGVTLDLTGSTGKTLASSATLTNNGTINWLDGGGIGWGGAPAIINNGVFNLHVADYMGSAGGTCLFTNNGTVNKTTTGSTSLSYVNFNNPGIVNVNSGTLRVLRGVFTNNASLNLTASTFQIGHEGTFYHNTGSTITGSGSLVLETFNSLLTLNIDLTLRLPLH